jgi:hypothetical protein
MMRVDPVLNLLLPGVEIGRHSIWLADKQIKVPFQFHGRICKYTHPGEPTYPLDSLHNEVAILKHMAALDMAPPIGEWVYFKTVISKFGGVMRIDPLGAWGYEMADAHTQPPGQFSLGRMRELPIQGSAGAWGDVMKPGNVINGYLVDVRRSGHDLLRWVDGPMSEAPFTPPFEPGLVDRVARDCQYPPGERPEPYQDYWLRSPLAATSVTGVETLGTAEGWVRGSRRVIERAFALGFDPQPGESVVDIGCQSGGFLQWSWLKQTIRPNGATGAHLGIDFQPEFIACARDLARAAQMGIDYRQMDVVQQTKAVTTWIRTVCGGRPDHLLLLSMEKHIGGAFWVLLDEIGARNTYIETNAYKPGSGAKVALDTAIEARGGEYIEDSNDRNPRRLYRISRPGGR